MSPLFLLLFNLLEIRAGTVVPSRMYDQSMKKNAFQKKKKTLAQRTISLAAAS